MPQDGQPDHGGGVDAAAAQYGGARGTWIDLSTGINPIPWPVPAFPAQAWTALPDEAAQKRLLAAARSFWKVPDQAVILAAPGASALIARMPAIAPAGSVAIPGPTYNEHARAFRAAGRRVTEDPGAEIRVIVHPNNPDGRLWPAPQGGFTVIDESFCDVTPGESHIALAARPGCIILKSFGKFWGLAGLRLGFAIGHPETLCPPGQPGMAALLGPWPVSGPALEIGAAALSDTAWAETARQRLARDGARLDGLMLGRGARPAGGTSLFRLYDVPDAAAWQAALARRQIWTRIFPYSATWLRLGLPGGETDWARLAAALETI